MPPKRRRPKRTPRIGEEFDRLTVKQLDVEATRYGERFWLCECRCGRFVSVRTGSLISGNSTSCGCKQREHIAALGRASKTHGQSLGCRQSPLYKTYYAMVRRCIDPKASGYLRYGARGITVCTRWLVDPAAFFTDMGGKPTPKHSLDRIDPYKGYWCGRSDCPECGPASRQPNCRWATAIEQGSNKTNNRRLAFEGRNLTIAEWARETGLDYRTIRGRIENGWSIKEALTRPLDGPRLITWKGQTKSLDEWARITGIPKSAIWQRLDRLGWSVKRTLTAPLQVQRKLPSRRQEAIIHAMKVN